jgi:DNA segregation ATPase FtsK/SpoIIIE, S-DNA-T family
LADNSRLGQNAGEPGNLPAIPSGEIEPDILEGEVVEDGPPSRATVIVVRPVIQIVQVIRVVVRHEHSRTAGRHISYIPRGLLVVVRRLWESRSTARYERMSRAAEQTGNHQAAIEWDQRRAEFVKARHDRRMQRAQSRINTAKALPWILASMLMAPFLLGVLLAIGERRMSAVTEPVEIIGDVVKWVAIAVSVSYGPFLLAAPWLALAALWHVGRRASATTGPGWLRTALPGDDISIDETTIAKALEALRIPQVRDYIKQGLPMQYIVPCRVDGRGTYAQLRLPKGVTAEKIARRRADLATGLYRSSTEVWPSTGSEAGILDLWVADKGALAEGAGPYPLLDEGFTDVFKGLPFGKTLRGDPARIPVIGRNTLCGGMPDQGKSSAARIVACGYTLDIATELRIYVPDTNFDFEWFKPRTSRYIMGAEDEFIEAILGELEDLKDEVQRRGQLLVDCGQPEVTAQVAATVPGLHPMFVLLEEAHVAIQHAKYGKDISQLLCDIVKLDRKRGIHLKLSTQAPTKDSMPRDVTRNCTNGIAFAVGDHVANDALLGQGAYSAGHRATDLIPGTDKGTALCKGFSGQRSEIVQVHFVDAKSDHNEVTPIVRRALAAMQDRGRAVPGSGRPMAITMRDLLTDLEEVLRDTAARVRVNDLPGRLRRLAPSWGEYRSLNGTQLREQLEALGVRTTNPKNVPTLDPAEVRRVLTDREQED